MSLHEDARKKIDTALVLKEKGNAFFKNSEYKKAIQQYAMSLSYTKVSFFIKSTIKMIIMACNIFQGMPGRGSTNNILSAVVAPNMLESSNAGSIGSLTLELETEINSLEVRFLTFQFTM